MSLHSAIVLGALGALMAIAVFMDLRVRRVPNWLTVGGASLGLALQGLFSGWGGVTLAAGGMLIGFAAMLFLYLFSALGAGDVKLMAAAGSFLGPIPTLWAAALTVAAGSLIALSIILVHGGVGKLLRRWGHAVKHLALTRTWRYIPPHPDEPAGLYFPYATAIATGVLTVAATRLYGA